MIDKLNILKQIIETKDELLLEKIATLLKPSVIDINGVKATTHEATPKELDIEKLKKEQNYDPQGLKKLMENWDYSIWKDVDIEQAIKDIGR